MPKRRYLKLTPTAKKELEQVRDHHQKPYMREKASALLQIAAGASAHQVAQSGLLKPRDPDSLYHWLNRYEQAGIQGLYVQAGRGRNAAFSP